LSKKNESKIQDTVNKTLNKGNLILFRGDFPHAGSEYKEANKRLFAQITIEANMHDGDEVGIV
jgi:hypothetical protein